MGRTDGLLRKRQIPLVRGSQLSGWISEFLLSELVIGPHLFIFSVSHEITAYRCHRPFVKMDAIYNRALAKYAVKDDTQLKQTVARIIELWEVSVSNNGPESEFQIYDVPMSMQDALISYFGNQGWRFKMCVDCDQDTFASLTKLV